MMSHMWALSCLLGATMFFCTYIIVTNATTHSKKTMCIVGIVIMVILAVLFAVKFYG